MNTLITFWIAFGVLFLIVEMITVTFYGLSIALSAMITAGYVWYVGDTEVTVVQGILFAVFSILGAYFLPKILMPHITESRQGLDIYIGEKRKVKKIGDLYKITLDGIDYEVTGDDIASGVRVEIIARSGAVFQCKVIQ